MASWVIDWGFKSPFFIFSATPTASSLPNESSLKALIKESVSIFNPYCDSNHLAMILVFG